MRIRAATEGDRDPILALIAQLQDAERSIEPDLPPGPAIAPAYYAELLDACRAHAGAVFVAAHAAHVQGFASVLARVPREGADETRDSYALLRDLVVARAGFEPYLVTRRLRL